MALIKCSECGKEISDTAKVCINCGAKTETEKKNKRKKVIILSIIVILIILSIASFLIIQKIKNKSNFTAQEVIDYLEKNDYNFEAMKSTISQYTTYYIYVNNEKDKIAFQKINNVIMGTIYNWKNNNLNTEWAEIKKTSENDTIAEKNQYEAYQKWIKKLGLNETQIIEALDYYSKNATYKNMD